MRDVESASSDEKLAQNLVCGPHRFIADEPVADGGGDAGPGPTEYLSLALAGCTTMTVKMVADRHQWPLRRVHVVVKQDRRPEGDFFLRTLTLEGALSDEQRQRLLEAAKRCPVSRILEQASTLETRLA
jgi:putative redox protein